MKQNDNAKPARFRPDRNLNVEVAPIAPSQGGLKAEFFQLKQRLLHQFLHTAERPELRPQVDRAANEAAAVAWLTPYPLLVFPGLFEEKTRAALDQEAYQEQVLLRSQEILAAAA